MKIQKLGRNLVAATVGAVLAQAAVAAGNCEALANPGQFTGTQIRSARSVAAEAGGGAPAFCEVTAVMRPVAGSQIVGVYRLPENWNGKMLGLGGGGWAGNLLLPTALPGLKRGYATAQTDGGHASTSAIDVSWVANNPVAVTDFSHRAVHEMTAFGKQLVAQHYGRAPTRNYFQGCSTGGRMGLMEAQRYPDDYDGVIAGAPVYTLVVQTSPVVRRQIFTAAGGFTAKQLERANVASTAACDAQDGAKDGVISDPRRCTWDPAELLCKAGAAGDCLNEQQVKALRTAYETQRAPDGVVGNYGLTRGSEAGWARFIAAESTTPLNPLNGGLAELIPLIFSNQKYDPASFDLRTQQAAVHRTAFAAEYEAGSTRLEPFFKRGGKLLLWHGFDDPGPSAYGTIDYFEKAAKANGPDSLQLFVAPGLYHCGGGPGADDFDLLSALENWVEKQQKPERLVARNRRTGDTRPLCAWPALPYFDGKGDVRDEHNFSCRVVPSPTQPR